LQERRERKEFPKVGNNGAVSAYLITRKTLVLVPARKSAEKKQRQLAFIERQSPMQELDAIARSNINSEAREEYLPGFLA
jgi:hypothetical protein